MFDAGLKWRAMRQISLLCVALCAIVAGPVFAQSSAEIEQALQRAKKYIYSVQTKDQWDLARPGPPAMPNAAGMINQLDIQNSSQWGGMTALATYALLASGDSPQDPKLAGAIEFLKKADIRGTYALGVRAQVWNSLPRSLHKQTLELAKRDRELILKNMRTDERCRPFFRYSADDPGCDHSASQFAVLGLWAVDQLGAEVPGGFWKMTEAAWLKDQDASGGWSYSNVFSQRLPVTPSMTAAGIATLFITNDYLHGPAFADCKGNMPHKPIDAGLAWLTAHAADVFELKNQFPYYTLYGIERIGLASGYKYLGTIDWYKEGCKALLASQFPDGSWNKNPADTCFGILFLVRGRAPVVMNKLEYELDAHGDKARAANWNQRPRDAANVSNWIGRQLEREVRWQIVNLRNSAMDLHDAPILYLAGNQVLALSDKDMQTLREFAQQGGIIVGHADCSSLAFTTTFKKLGTRLFPPYEFRELPAGHLIYDEIYSRKKWRNPPPVQGLSNGVRELMILLPAGDPARFWQTGAIAGHEPVYELMANLFLYATEHRDLRTKPESWLVTPQPNVAPPTTLRVARLSYEGNWNPEPAGWPRLAAILHNQNAVELKIVRVKLGDHQLGAAPRAGDAQGGYRLAHLTATGKFTLRDAQRAELKAFVESGGTLFVDAAGGESQAAQSLEAELTALAGAKATPLPLDHPLYKNLGMPALEVAYLPFSIKRSLGQIKGARLRAITVKDRPAIFFSPEDVSAGLVGEAMDGIFGYTPESAVAVARAVVMGAVGQ
jgi:hypothetical protein